MLTDMLAAPSHIMGPGGVGSRPCAAPRAEGPGEGAGSQEETGTSPDAGEVQGLNRVGYSEWQGRQGDRHCEDSAEPDKSHVGGGGNTGKRAALRLGWMPSRLPGGSDRALAVPSSR